MGAGVAVSKLNSGFLVTRIDDLGLRRWWIAEQIGVDRRTLYRWLSGKTGRIPDAKLRRLAEIVKVDVPDLLTTAQPFTATAADQVRAARSLLDSNLLESLMPPHQFGLFERLAKGLVVEGLSDEELGHLYMAISLALFRQSKLDDAFHYASLARQIARTLGDRHLQLRAAMQLSFREYVRGDHLLAIRLDHANLRLARALRHRRLTAANLSNLGDQYCGLGRWQASEAMQREAIRLYEQEQVPTSLVFCHLGLVMLYLGKQDHGLAEHHLGVARSIAVEAGFQRGLADCDLFESVWLAETGRSGDAVARLDAALDAYRRLTIQEPRTYALAARVYRLVGRLADAASVLRQGFDLVQKNETPGLARELIAEQRELVP